MDDTGVPCLFLGFATNKSAYRCMKLHSRKIVETVDVKFLDAIFRYKTIELPRTLSKVKEKKKIASNIMIIPKFINEKSITPNVEESDEEDSDFEPESDMGSYETSYKLKADPAVAANMEKVAQNIEIDQENLVIDSANEETRKRNEAEQAAFDKKQAEFEAEQKRLKEYKEKDN